MMLINYMTDPQLYIVYICMGAYKIFGMYGEHTDICWVYRHMGVYGLGVYGGILMYGVYRHMGIGYMDIWGHMDVHAC